MTKTSKISIGVILFGTKYLAESLPSLIVQDYKNIEFLLLDQEEDKWSAFEFIKKNLPNIYKNSRVKIAKGKNLWHSGGQNKLIHQALKNGSEYYICASNDMLYSKNLVSSAIVELEKAKNKKFGSATVKIKQWKYQGAESSLKSEKWKVESGKHKIRKLEPRTQNLEPKIDSCGIGITTSHYFYDIGQGEIDTGQYDQQREIFGPSGALAIFRRDALLDVVVDNNFFDEKLHYKNDVDLAYRFQWLGWKSLFISQIEVLHDRQTSGTNNLFSFFQDRKKIQDWAKESSAFGQNIVLAKNFSSDFSWQVKFRTMLRKCLLYIFGMFFERASLRGFYKAKKIQKKVLKSRRKVSAKEIEKYFSVPRM
jgi:GT2 family glycosyltransferase